MTAMSEADVVDTLMANAETLSPVELVRLVVRVHGPLTLFLFVATFKRAFPEIPLNVLHGAGAWKEVGGPGGSDREFNLALKGWLPRAAKSR